MVDNQHKKITGYRDLSEEEIAAMNLIKAQGVKLEEICSQLAAMPGVDKRWLAIGVTDLQKGLMSVVRSIAQPTSF